MRVINKSNQIKSFYSWSNFNFHVKRCEAVLDNPVTHPFAVRVTPGEAEGNLQETQEFSPDLRGRSSARLKPGPMR
jgi:hypothetical protein